MKTFVKNLIKKTCHAETILASRSVILSEAKNLKLAPSLTLYWICSTLTEFRQSCYATKGSICSLSGLVLLRTSANPLPRGEGKGFTLAEVLITLGIIGVVAALTLPSLIESHKERVTVNKVKKFYSIMSQAQLLAIKDNGYLDEWQVSDGRTKNSAEELMPYFKPYLKIVRDCGTSRGCLEYSEPIKKLDGTTHYNYDTDNGFYKFILSDGTYMWLRASLGKYCASSDSGVSDTCGAVWIDVNGKKSPNTLGMDIFYFLMTKNRLVSSVRDDCNINAYGWACAGWILEHGNMDYLK